MKEGMNFGNGTVMQPVPEHLEATENRLRFSVTRNGVFENGVLNHPSIRVGEYGDWKKFAKEMDFAVIAIPSTQEERYAPEYIKYFWRKGKPVIFASKQFLASNGGIMLAKQREGLVYLNAAVGGTTEMPDKVTSFPEPIREIKAVMNGTTNYIGWADRQGRAHQTILQEIESDTDAKGARNLSTVLWAELINDLVLGKVPIVANLSGMFEKIITYTDVTFVPPPENGLSKKRGAVHITPERILAGFIVGPEEEATWFPNGFPEERDNVLVINGKEVARGVGSGPRTAETIARDIRRARGARTVIENPI